MRIDRLLANSGYGSRSEVRALIRAGRVALAGTTVCDPGTDIPDSERSALRIDGQLALIRRYYYLMLDKPSGVITALDDPTHRTIAEFIPAAYEHAGLSPVGRLDRDTTGLLILTNDGILNHRLTSPKHGVEKVYDVVFTGPPLDPINDPPGFAAGIKLADGFCCQPAKLQIIGSHHAQLTITEGKFHQVKRMFAAGEREVTALRRLSVGPLQLDSSLGSGGIRELTEAEITALYETASLERPY